MQPEISGLTGFEEIGRGGFGTVYRADDTAHGRTVAVKVLRQALDEDGQARFERECRAAGSLSGHPNIVSIHSSGVTAAGDPYLVMDHLSGGSLADRVAAGGPLAPDGAIELGVGLADALAAAHARGIVHRDVKPENVLFSAFGAPQLVDFGIARMASEFETRSGSISASLAHAPPEVIAGAPASAEGDVYALASTLFFALTGRAPFQGDAEETLAPLIARISTEPPPDLRVDGVPGELAEVIERGLAKSPAERTPSAAAFGEELRAAASALGAVVPPLLAAGAPLGGPIDDAAASAVTGPLGDGPSGQGRGRSRRILGIAVVAVALVVAAVVAFIATRPEERQEVSTGRNRPATTTTSAASAAAPSVVEDPVTEDGLEVARRYDIKGGDAIGSSVTVTNTTDQTAKRIWFEVVPKQLAASVADVDFSRAPTGTVVDDPVVYWVLTLDPGAQQTLRWTTPLPAGGEPTQAYLERIVRLHRAAVADADDEIRFATAALERDTGAAATDPTDTVADPGAPVDPASSGGGGTTTTMVDGGSVGTTATPGTTRPATTTTTSTTTTSTTAPPLAKPGAPTSVVARNPTMASTGATKTVNVALSWGRPSSGGSITGYRVRHRQRWTSGCSTGTSAWIEVAVSGTTATLGADTQCGSSWVEWQVAAVNASGVGPYTTATGVVPDVIGKQWSYHLVRAIGGKAGGLAERDCGQPAYAACYVSPGAGTSIASGTGVAISQQLGG